MGRTLQFKSKVIVNMTGAVLFEKAPDMQYEFDGSTMYATMAGWETLGDPAIYESTSYQTDNDDGYVIGPTRPLVEMCRVGANYHAGTAYDVNLTDTSPLQNTTACMGNANRRIQLDSNIILNGDWDIEMEWIREDYAGNNGVGLVGGRSTGEYIFALDTGAGAANALRIKKEAGSNLSIAGVLNGVALGQHIHLRVANVGGTITAYVDGQSKGSVADDGLQFQINTIAGYVGAATSSLPTDSAIQNVKIVSASDGVAVLYKLNEGSGIDVEAWTLDGTGRLPAFDGNWISETTDTDWQYIPDNSRRYPMNEGAKGGGVFQCFDGTGKAVPAYDATIINYNADNWK